MYVYILSSLDSCLPLASYGFNMEPTAAGNLLEIMDLARTLRREQLFIQHEQAAFAQLTGSLEMNAATITKVGLFAFG